MLIEDYISYVRKSLASLSLIYGFKLRTMYKVGRYGDVLLVTLKFPLNEKLSLRKRMKLKSSIKNIMRKYYIMNQSGDVNELALNLYHYKFDNNLNWITFRVDIQESYY